MKIIRSMARPALLTLFVMTGSVIAQPAVISCLTRSIAGERAKAETCVALIKKYGDDAQKAIGGGVLDAKANGDPLLCDRKFVGH
jgi:hypothetical protein